MTGDIDISTDPTRVNLDAVWNYLSTQAYWGRTRTRDTVEGQIASAWRVVAAYDDGALVGFARAVSDAGLGIAYLADVFVLPSHSGRGIATRMLEELIENGPGRDIRWFLFTKDAHGLYRKFGFEAPDEKAMVRPAR